MAKATEADQAKDAAWNIVSGTPLVGSIANVGALGVDLWNYGQAEAGSEAQAQAQRDMQADFIGMVPLVGTVTGYGSVIYDCLADGDTGGNVMNQLLGGKDQYPVSYDEDGYNSAPALPPNPYAPYAEEEDIPMPDYSDQICE